METGEQDVPELSAEQQERILSLMQKMMGLGICAVYGQEDEGLPDADVDCASKLRTCRAVCCTLQFALTKEEARQGHLKHNRSRPFFIARGDDGYCLHLERETMRCEVWTDRPLRCRRYDCRVDPKVAGPAGHLQDRGGKTPRERDP